MTEQKPNAAELLSQIDEFEATLNNLLKNVSGLREKITKNREQYGEDVSSWPKI